MRAAALTIYNWACICKRDVSKYFEEIHFIYCEQIYIPNIRKYQMVPTNACSSLDNIKFGLYLLITQSCTKSNWSLWQVFNIMKYQRLGLEKIFVKVVENPGIGCWFKDIYLRLCEEIYLRFCKEIYILDIRKYQRVEVESRIHSR